MNEALTSKMETLRGIFAPMTSVIVAFSGGVDSTFVLKVAHETIGARLLALTHRVNLIDYVAFFPA